MPTYRLLSSHHGPLRTFDADDDTEAVHRGRELAADDPALQLTGGEPLEYLVARRDPEAEWRVVESWMPRPPGI